MYTEDFKLIITEDGSHTLYNSEQQEGYHSIHGALTESNHIFIKNGLETLERPSIKILEMGFGTGLNAYLSCLYATQRNLPIYYTALEKYPLPFDVFSKLNYPDLLKEDKALFLKLHTTSFHNDHSINDQFRLIKVQTDLLNYQTDQNFDLVYFDAFNPDLQPELWTNDVFKKLYNCMSNHSILITYSAKGRVKRALKQAGFQIIPLNGPPGKREITKAIKN